MAKPISETIRLFQGGDFNIKAGELFASVLRGVEDTGKAGKLTITLDVKQQNGAVSVLAKVTDKTPEVLPDADLYWTTPDGNLTLRNPAQRELELKNVDASTGEIRSVSSPTQAIQQINQVPPAAGIPPAQAAG
jgi:hypothetical protein